MKKTIIVILFFLVAPVNAQIVLLSPMSEEFSLLPGEKKEAVLIVENRDKNSDVEIEIQQVDYFFSFDGTTVFPEPGSQRRSNASWIKLSPLLLIPKGEKVQIPFEISAPKKVSGSFWSVFLVSAKKSTRAKTEKKIGVMLKMQYAVQIITHIKDSGILDFKFLNSEFKDHKLLTDVENTGTVSARPMLILRIKKDGKVIQTIEDKKFRLHPGTSCRYETPLSLEPGIYEVETLLLAKGELWGRKLSLQF